MIVMDRGTVSIVRSDTHYEGTLKALELIDSEIRGVVGGRKKFLIKPNFVSTSVYLSATPKETVDAILNYLYENYDVSEVLIAESPASARAEEGYRNYGYYELRKKYPGLEFGDLDDYDQVEFKLVDEHGEEFSVYVSRLLLDKSFVKVSPCRAKTHDTVVVTLSIKNMVMGGIRRGYKPRMHRGYYSINYNIALLATKMMPDLGVVDGVIGMEGNGPVNGEPKKWGVVFASTNPVNLDVAVAYGMGFDPRDIGYLYFLAKWGYGGIDPDKIPIIGEKIENIKTRFKPHSKYERQLRWKEMLG
ncbi:MAG: DUF362 domain-containing protein [Staphylothermus sp.]|nr:DUF362 domain-containing protein [Staphylothermus sp.]